ncbi:hypothetical protein RHMOL_Rhmol08G0196200 [Rhododendron molle]|uniref:Uncharacterized protein n=3 Tax=Rhododendron molle TaxID=49168 RepID=A0ACC0MQI7_RHOML|nr:hypothetical protein RHMOL_Rhmol08G0196200 [Rhododendron molle]KAI8543163.1 hypothetical protein RHMOL_Rhmol08G0196200 [Rhododendron molle]KAI8543164.1 hypothetical protein RHMOL_Rhmol08G0196200 [Rhododendron molle]
MSMDPAHFPSTEASNSELVLKRNSNDVGWDYGVIVDVKNKDRLRCILCGNPYTGGVNRMKKHIDQVKGDVAACTKASKEDILKCKKALDETIAKKKEKKQGGINLREEVNIVHEEGRRERKINGVCSMSAGVSGLVDVQPLAQDLVPKTGVNRYTEINPGSSDTTTSGFKKVKQPNIKDAIWKKRSHDVSQYLARWVYEAGIPFHAIDNDGFKRFVEAVGQFGPGYEPPSQYQLREPLLKEEMDRTKKLLKRQEEEWALTGCSIMTDAWTDRKRRSIMNLCVNCKQGTCFLSSKEDSEASHMGVYIFEYVDKFIKDIGAQNVVQVVKDNASNNMAAADLLKIKRPNIFWTSCGTHTINLMLEGIGKQSKFKGIIDKAKAFTIFVYAHHNTLAMMRKYTKRRDIVRPGVTRFVTAFLTLQSLMEKKQELRAMFSGEAWDKSKWAKSPKGKTTFATVMSTAFWNGVTLCLKVFGPLVIVLRLVDGDRKPTMGFVYGELKNAKEEIKGAYKQVETNYWPILDVIDGKAKGRLDSALHLTGYFLNPFYFYKDHTIQDDPIIMDGVLTCVCVEAFFLDDVNVQDEVINRELLKYKNKEGGFGRPLATMGCATNNDSYDPGWIVEGGDVDEEDPVSRLTWEMIGEATGVDEALQPRRTTRNVGVRELHEEDFLSEDDPEKEVDEDFEFESDGDQEWASEHCSAPFRAPELWDCQSHADIDERTDIWSLGCTLFAIMYGASPFEYALGESGGSLQLAIVNGQVKWPAGPNPPYPEALHKFVTWMLQPQATVRPRIDDIIIHVDKLISKFST